MALATAPPPTSSLAPKPPTRAWWKEVTVYQIYPSSFQDSNGDGLGDIPGITSRLDYIKSLGVDIVWVSPILASPQVDMGYDISDYRNIHRPYGTMADHDALIKGLHDRGMKYVMDLVVNHTSDQHEWFKESRTSKDNPYRDWYYWRPPRYDKDGTRRPPNNWRSYFAGSVWEWDEHTQEYYLHLFAKEQPDLNWENPKVVKAVHDLVRFWLDRGVDGFRMDVINFISKPHGLPDAPVTVPEDEVQWASSLYACGPHLHEFFRGLGSIMKEYNAFSVGEMPGVHDTAEILKAVGEDRGELQMSFNFEIASMDNGLSDKYCRRDYSVTTLKSIVSKWQTYMLANGGWNALYLENHDQSRTVSRYASAATPELRTLSAKMLATHLALQSGTLFVYQGQELGMVNIPKEWGLDKYRDIECLNHWKEFIEKHPDDLKRQQEVKREYWLKSRDNARTPMQWDETANAGFCKEGVTPWIDIHEDFVRWNAANQTGDPNSPFSYWKSVLALRKKEKDVFVYGMFEIVDAAHPQIFAYCRTAFDGGQKALVMTNFANEEVLWKVPSDAWKVFGEGKVVLRSYPDGPTKVKEDAAWSVRPFEAFVVMA